MPTNALAKHEMEDSNLLVVCMKKGLAHKTLTGL